VQNLDLEQEMINAAGSRLAAEIDFGVMCSFLEEIGWTRVILKPMTKEQGDAIDFWTSHLKGNFHTMGLVWIFEDPADAVDFTLRWA
jgi:hypothetical protein